MVDTVLMSSIRPDVWIPINQFAPESRNRKSEHAVLSNLGVSRAGELVLTFASVLASHHTTMMSLEMANSHNRQ